jgi:hypothetical protein
MEAEEERGEAVDEVGLGGELVGVPDAVEEALPELLEVVFGEVALRRKPRLEDDPEGLVPGGLVARRQLLYQ